MAIRLNTPSTKDPGRWGAAESAAALIIVAAFLEIGTRPLPGLQGVRGADACGVIPDEVCERCADSSNRRGPRSGMAPGRQDGVGWVRMADKSECRPAHLPLLK
jgi:hypothetical protein